VKHERSFTPDPMRYSDIKTGEPDGPDFVLPYRLRIGALI